MVYQSETTRTKAAFMTLMTPRRLNIWDSHQWVKLKKPLRQELNCVQVSVLKPPLIQPFSNHLHNVDS